MMMITMLIITFIRATCSRSNGIHFPAYRSSHRLPVLTWLHRNGASLCRSSQPLVGLLDIALLWQYTWIVTSWGCSDVWKTINLWRFDFDQTWSKVFFKLEIMLSIIYQWLRYEIMPWAANLRCKSEKSLQTKIVINCSTQMFFKHH